MGLWPWTRVQGRGWGSRARGFSCNTHWGAQSCAWPQGSRHGIHRPPGHRCLHTACSGIPGEVTRHRGLPMACTGIPGWAWGSPHGHSVPRAVVGHGDLLMVCPEQLPGMVPGAKVTRGWTLGSGRVGPPCPGPARASSSCVARVTVPAGAVAAAGPACGGGTGAGEELTARGAPGSIQACI